MSRPVCPLRQVSYWGCCLPRPRDRRRLHRSRPRVIMAIEWELALEVFERTHILFTGHPNAWMGPSDFDIWTTRVRGLDAHSRWKVEQPIPDLVSALRERRRARPRTRRVFHRGNTSRRNADIFVQLTIGEPERNPGSRAHVLGLGVSHNWFRVFRPIRSAALSLGVNRQSQGGPPGGRRTREPFSQGSESSDR